MKSGALDPIRGGRDPLLQAASVINKRKTNRPNTNRSKDLCGDSRPFDEFRAGPQMSSRAKPDRLVVREQ